MEAFMASIHRTMQVTVRKDKILSVPQYLTDDHYQIDVNQENAEIDVVFTEELSHDGSLLLRSLILGLTSVEEEHEQYLDVIFKEV